MSELGGSAAALALALCAYAAGASFHGARTGSTRWADSGARALWAAGAALTVCVATLLYALVTWDFRLSYVVRNTSLATPLLYRVTALWGAQAGSLLFWSWLLALVASAAVAGQRRQHPQLSAWACAVLSAVLGFFLFLVVLERPFRTLPFAPADGRGLNPLLEDPGMVAHPPLLYLGFVGLAVPYAFAMAALVTRRLDAGWVAATRRWTVASWLSLGAGLVVGGWWAYRTLGWGGYWGWDPVENAALVPWLVATAYLHSAVVQERRGAFAAWNLTLVVLAFGTAVLGTFLTRTGLVVSVHSFARSEIGPYFLGFVALLLAASFALVAWRWDDLRGSPPVDDLRSREGAFLFNNVLFLSFAGAVLVGTLYPLAIQAAGGPQVFVGPPYFHAVAAPVGVALLVLMGVAVGLPWRRAGPGVVARFRYPLFAALMVAMGSGVVLRRPGVVAAAAALSFALSATLQAFHDAGRAGARIGRGYLQGLLEAFRTQPRRYGGYVVHLGVLVMVVGIVGSHGYVREREVTVRPGQTFTVGPYVLRYRSLEAGATALADARRATVELREDGRSLLLQPVRLFYPRWGQVVSRPAIRSTWREDVYVVLWAFQPDGSATFRAWVNPLVRWVWLGALLAAVGTVVTLGPRGGSRRAVFALGPWPLRQQPARDGHGGRAVREVLRALRGPRAGGGP
ncbi:MAG: heme lyase CcmF/NrfE family subunit [Armatimonadota bacterium]|nr:heme lyase CcmF/NrfE family subunit [Armatimonadota bacterium]MDR5675601.1 heme lyase CcmF/NrfE family subunit [Armatimonadota bacterium]MDR5689810.1 heme lyase CcmF/NrfE family subunit [Armatimonadota bacterium]MDR7386035.1 heme lyase CcmF/NrfE family subunit [Armatimonadota bacterium]MDR7391980.1 heme lyase CcmF/NrfE family subunit [Armatimonadota bacterium]